MGDNSKSYDKSEDDFKKSETSSKINKKDFYSSLKKNISKLPFLYLLIYYKKSLKNKLFTIKAYYSIKKNNLFDEEYYLKNYPKLEKSNIDPLLHYLTQGCYEGKSPNSYFNADYYFNKYDDVEKSGLNPFIHYELYGKKEKREIKPLKSTSLTFKRFLTESYNSPLVSSENLKKYEVCLEAMGEIASQLIEKTNLAGNLPLVSVIMPVYNRKQIVEGAIKSVLNQTYPNFELIIVDDGSDDGTIEILEKIKDNRVTLIFNEENKGVSASRNIALKKSKGKYIAYLDSDNTWDENYISGMIGGFLEIGDADAIYSGQLIFRESNHPFALRFVSFNKSLIRNRNYVDLNCFIHERSLYEKLGGFDEALKRCVDWDMIERFAIESKIYSVPIVFSNYYENKATNRISSESSYSYCEQVRERNINKFKSFLDNRSFDKLNKKVNIVIPNHESIENLKKTLYSLFNLKLNEKFVKIIVLEKYSNKKNISFLKGLEKENKIKLIVDKEIANLSQFNINEKIFTSKDNYYDKESDILILGTNTTLTKQSLEIMQKCSYKLKDCGLIIPQQIVPPHSKIIKKASPFAIPHFEYDVTTSFAPNNIDKIGFFHSGDILELNFGFLSCFYMKRKVFNNIGEINIDINHNNTLNKEPCEYIKKDLGLKIYNVSGAVVYHQFKENNIMNISFTK